MSKIEWTDVTDNIITVEGGGWWCRKISAGCANCYAAKLNQSAFFGGNKLPYIGAPPKLKLRTDIIDGWARMRKPKRHFVASMTDVFGEWVPVLWVFSFLNGMRDAPNQTFQVLTKRPAVMRRMVDRWLKTVELDVVPSNIWLGVSVENQETARSRLPDLLNIPAAVRFVSYEPALGPVDFRQVVATDEDHTCFFPLMGEAMSDAMNEPRELRHGGIHWVICGGESGPGARPIHPDWARSVRDQCREAGVAFFFKQWGEWAPGECAPGPVERTEDVASWFSDEWIYERLTPRASEEMHRDDEPDLYRIGKKSAGRLLDGRTWDEFPVAQGRAQE